MYKTQLDWRQKSSYDPPQRAFCKYNLLGTKNLPVFVDEIYISPHNEHEFQEQDQKANYCKTSLFF